MFKEFNSLPQVSKYDFQIPHRKIVIGRGDICLVGLEYWAKQFHRLLHPGYYPRFGFVTASKTGIKCEFEVPAEAFMVKELEPGYLQEVYGVIRYHDVFKNL